MTDVCYFCGCSKGERRLYPTVDPKIRICGACDNAMKRRKDFKPVAEGMAQLREFEKAEKPPCDG